jgi:hypothetical protein
MNNNYYKLNKYTHKILNSLNNNFIKHSIYWNHFNHHLNNITNSQLGGNNIDEIVKLFQNLDENIVKKYDEIKKESDNYKKESDNYKKESDNYKKESDNYKKESDNYKIDICNYKKSNMDLQTSQDKNIQDFADRDKEFKEKNKSANDEFISALVTLYKHIIEKCKDTNTKNTSLCKSVIDKENFINQFAILKSSKENQDLFNSSTAQTITL